MTNERAAVQVKSQTDQNQLNDYAERFNSMSADKYFYAYHTTKKFLNNPSPALILMGPEELSAYVLNCGLLDWLIEKVG